MARLWLVTARAGDSHQGSESQLLPAPEEMDLQATFVFPDSRDLSFLVFECCE